MTETNVNKAAAKKTVENIYPLSSIQQGILFHSLYEPDSGIYLGQISCCLEGKLDGKAFQLAWQQVVARHTVLRTSFHWTEQGQPFQIVHKHIEIPWELHDWRELSAKEQQEQLEAYKKRDQEQPFDPGVAPLFRLHLLQLTDTSYYFLWTNHHAIFDGWSRALLFKDLFDFYSAACQGQNLMLPPPRPYQQYISWLGRQDQSLSEQYWRKLLDGFVAPTPLPHDYTGQTHKDKRQVTLSIALSENETIALQQAARRLHVTINTLVQTSWALLLSRYSGTDDIVFGVTVSGRPADLPGVEEMVGVFINTLPMRVQIDPEQTVERWLKLLQEQFAELRQYEHTQLVDIQEWSQVPRGLALFESILVFENYPLDSALLERWNNIQIRNMQSVIQTNYPLTIAVIPGAHLHIEIGYTQERFSAATVGRMAGHLLTVLAGIASNSRQAIKELPFLTVAERRQMLEQWNATKLPGSPEQGVHQLIEAHALNTPDAIALVYEDQHITYAELNTRANQLAHYLQRRGIGPEMRVALCLERSPDMIIGFLAILKAGGVYVPFNATYPLERLAFMLNDADVSAILTHTQVQTQLLAGKIPVIDMDRAWSHIRQEPCENPCSNIVGTNLAYIIYTSGSTGQPKGVLLTHHGLYNLSQAQKEYFGTSSNDRIFQFAALSFDASIWEIVMALTIGRVLVMVKQEALLIGTPLVEILQKQNVTIATLPPSALAVLPISDIPALRIIVTAGEACSAELVTSWAFNRQFINAYGPTETTVCATMQLCRPDGEKPPIGRPIGGTQVYVLDVFLQPVPIGVTGELYIGGESLARGYLNRPDITAEYFIPDPFSRDPGTRLYRTGDLVRYLADGEVEYVGRSDRQVKIRAFRIEPGEIEVVLAQHPAVREVVVLARESSGSQQLVAYLVLAPESDGSPQELRTFLSHRLPAYMLPTAFVLLPAFPLTPHGKIDRRSLPAPAFQQAGGSSLAPALRTPLQELVASLWSQLLERPVEQAEADFFALGGHSLLAMRVLARLHRLCGVQLPLRTLFEAPTLSAFSAALEAALRSREGASPYDLSLLSTTRPDLLPLSFAQQRLWFLEQWEPDNALYNLAVALKFEGQLRVQMLIESVEGIVQRHEGLRTSFRSHNGQPYQHIVEQVSVPFALIDLSALPPTLQQRTLSALVEAEARHPFALHHAPLLRLRLVYLAHEQQVLLLTLHHLVADGWSLSVLLYELQLRYLAACEQRPVTLPALSIQYPDYALWQRAMLQGERLQQLLDYWSRHLAHLPQLTGLPTDHPRPTLQQYRGALHSFSLTPQQRHDLLHLAQQEGVSLFMLLLAAFQLLLSRYSRQEDIVVGTPIANRSLPELEPLIGCLLNILVLRTDLSGDPSFRDLLQRVRRVCLEAYTHQDLPFERLVDELQPQRGLSHTPLVQVAITWQTTPLQTMHLPYLDVQLLEDKREYASAKFDLILNLIENAQGLQATFTYSTKLFEKATIQRMAGHFQTLLQNIVAQPEQRLSQLSLLTSDERLQLLDEWNDTDRPYPHKESIHQRFEEQAAQSPDAIAVVYEDQQLTYEELNRRSDQLACYLQQQMLQPEARIGVCLERSPDLVIGLLGILKAGGVYVPLDSNYPQERLAFMIQDANISTLLTYSTLLDLLPREVHERVHIVCLDTQRAIAHMAAQKVESLLDSNSLAYIVYTSGSTGRPKGIGITHRNVNRLVLNTDYIQLSAQDCIAHSSNISFDAATFELWGTLLNGSRLVILNRETVLSPLELAQQVRGYGINVLFLTTALFNQVAHIAPHAFVSLSTLFFGGEAVDPRWVWETMAHTPPARLLHMYGPAENTTYSTWQLVESISPTDLTVPIGQSIANSQAYVLDRSMNCVPIGIPGELYLGGDGLARGYLGRPELTAERFVPHPFSKEPGARLYRTGDLVCWQGDGRLTFLGRLDSQVKLRGFRIELGEIEAVLRTYPQVHDAVVLLRQEQEGTPRLVAYVVPSSLDEQPAPEHMRHFLQERLPEYMLPAAFVVLDHLPITANGKVDRQELPAPLFTRSQIQENYVAPQTPNEQRLVEIWQQVLGLPPEAVGTQDNFFTLGGDSILSIQVITRARQAGLQLTPRQIFQQPTIAQLAALCEQASPTVVSGAEQGILRGEIPLTPIQRWFLAQKQPHPDHANQALLLHPQQPLQADALTQALHALLQQHDALRLRFLHTSQGYQQHMVDLSEQPPLLQQVDLQALPPSREPIVFAEATRQVQASLHLHKGPLLRAVLFERAGTRGQRLLLVIHHLAVDAVSWRILLEDLEQSYQQALLSQPLRLPAKTSSYRQWAERLLDFAQQPGVSQQVAYWSQQGQHSANLLPFDGPGKPEAAANIWADTFHIHMHLSEQQTRALLQQVPQVYRTQIQEVLLAALLLAWTQQTGQRSLRLDLEGHGRQEEEELGVDLSRTVGWFTTLYPVVLHLENSQQPGEVLKQVKEHLRQIPQYGLGYGLLRYLSADPTVQEQLAHVDASTISFNYLGQFDNVWNETGLFAPARDSAGPAYATHNSRFYALDIVAQVEQGELQVRWSYSRQLYQQATIEALANTYLAQLQTIIEHCQAPEAGGYTPSDFPLAALDQETLDKVLDRKRHIEDLYPLSPTQHGLLFHSIYESGSGIYVEQLSSELHGKLDVTTFEWAWQQAVAHHAILRTSFLWENLDDPLQLVEQRVDFAIEQHDWRELSEAEQQARLQQRLQQDKEQGFDLTCAPLLRLSLFQIAKTTYQLIWTVHHLTLDGWSLSNLLKEVFTSYEAKCKGYKPKLTTPKPYRNYIAWLQQQELSEAESFWRHSLAGFEQPTPLPQLTYSASFGSEPVKVMQHEQAILSQQSSQRLQQIAHEHQLTLSTLLQGAWALLLSRLSGRPEVVFGVTVSGRSAGLPGMEQMVGLFINTLPLRVYIEPQQPLLSWLQTLQTQMVEIQRYEYTPLARIQGWSAVPGGIPLFESIVVFENYPVDETVRADLSGVQVRQTHIVDDTNYPLTIAAIAKSQIKIDISYSAERFEQETIAFITDHLRNLLEETSIHINQSVGEISIFTDLERKQLLEEWSSVTSISTESLCIHQRFEERVVCTPDAIALVHDKQHLTYAELNARSNQLAHHLQRSGIGIESRVGLSVERVSEMIVGLLGILKAGAAYIPLDPTYPKARLTYMIEDSRLDILLTQHKLLSQFEAGTARIFCLDTDWSEINHESTENPRSQVTADHLAYVIYTSGSTGQPKGTMILHRSVVNYIEAAIIEYEAKPEDRILQFASISFDISAEEIYLCLLRGATLVLRSDATPTSITEFLQNCRNRGLTLLSLPTAFWHEMVRHIDIEALTLPPSLRFIIVGGEKILPARLALWQKRIGQYPRLVNTYGPTETTIVTTSQDCSEPIETDTSLPEVSIGRPVNNVQVYVLNQYQQPVYKGTPGELYIGGAGLARGYLGRPELTAERFVPHPFSKEPGARLYRTGDLVCWQGDGRLTFLGRLDSQVKLRGFRIELGEIEAMLRTYPALHDAVVLLRQEQESTPRLVAYVVPSSPDEQPTPDQVRRFLQQRLPDYMLPASFIFLEHLPVTVNGKVDRKALPAPQSTRPDLQQHYIPPQTPIEQQLAEIWQQVLHVEQVGMQDNFFTLGGDSILSIQVVTRVRQAGLQLTPRQIFQHPTIAQLAALCEQPSAIAEPTAEQGILQGEVPLTPIQRWFLAQEQLYPDHANQAILLHPRQPVQPAALAQALSALLQQHDGLRLRFRHTAQGHQQYMVGLSEQPPLLQQVDLQALPPSREPIVFAEATRQVQASLHLQEGPLMRAVLFERADTQEQRLLLVIHHLAVDAVSWRILLEDLHHTYQQALLSQPLSLPAKTSSYRQWAERLLDFARQPAISQQVAYWSQQGQEPASFLPFDGPGKPEATANTRAEVATIQTNLGEQQTRALLQQVPQVYRTQIQEVLLAALLLAWTQQTGQRSLRLDLEGHGRQEEEELGVDLSRTVGWFTTLYPVVLRLENSQQPGEVLKQVKEHLRQIPQYGLGYGLLRYLSADLTVQEQLAQTDTSTISFNYLGQFDQSVTTPALWDMATESAGPTVNEQDQRSHLIDITTQIMRGRLYMNWSYIRYLYQQTTIEALANTYLAQLQSIIQHCQAPEAGGYTPSDFPDVVLSQDDLDNLSGQFDDIFEGEK